MKAVAITLATLLCVPAYASEFFLYRDKAEYLLDDHKGGFIGYTDTAKAYCGGEEIYLSPYFGNEIHGSLGALALDIKAKEAEITAAENTIRTAEFLLASLGQIGSVDKLNDGKVQNYASKKFAEISKAQAEINVISAELDFLKREFAKGTDGRDAQGLKESCAKLKLVLDRITADYENVLYLEDNNKAKTELVLKATNRSGVDIKANTAHMLPSFLNASLGVPEFDPWYVRSYENMPQAKNLRMAAVPMMASADAVVMEQVVSREAPSQFKITNFNLPSDGKAKKFVLDSANVSVESRLAVYPFINTTVFRETVFTPKTELYGTKWRVVKGNDVYENVYAKFEEGKIRLAAGIDKDISIKRKDIPLTRESDGIFGSKKRMKRGFTIEAANISPETKSFTIIERVPVSGDDRIVIENIAVNGQKVQVEQDGKLIIPLELGAGMATVYKVTFEIVADRNLDVVF
jgi:hypothetical protein